MRKNIRNTIYLILGLVVVLVLSVKSLSKYLSTRYDTEMNEQRQELGLATISDNWSLDSISMWEIETFCQYWTPSNTVDKSKPYLRHKEIIFHKGFWFWDNSILGEQDFYVNPFSALRNEELRILYDFNRKKWFIRLDTIDTQLKIQHDNAQSDSIVDFAEKNNLFICGGALNDLDFVIDTIGLTREQADDILKEWGIE